MKAKPQVFLETGTTAVVTDDIGCNMVEIEFPDKTKWVVDKSKVFLTPQQELKNILNKVMKPIYWLLKKAAQKIEEKL